jgi:hypothetical protein
MLESKAQMSGQGRFRTQSLVHGALFGYAETNFCPSRSNNRFDPKRLRDGQAVAVDQPAVANPVGHNYLRSLSVQNDYPKTKTIIKTVI